MKAIFLALLISLHLLPALRAAPYPPSPIITRLIWDDAVFKLKAGAGDNWPITWAEGDLQITSWGDGPGFDGQPPRLCLGFARIWGDPPNLRAEDFASDANTLEGSGSKAIKASGLLLVDNTLYMWVRNYRPPGSDDFTNARLAWSRNRGTDWTWADWHFADTFGCPEFVQFDAPEPWGPWTTVVYDSHLPSQVPHPMDESRWPHPMAALFRPGRRALHLLPEENHAENSDRPHTQFHQPSRQKLNKRVSPARLELRRNLPYHEPQRSAQEKI